MNRFDESRGKKQEVNGLGDANEELFWRAFCYVHDELTANERAAFERELADVESVQAAVVDAVELTDIIRLLPPTCSTTVMPYPRRPAAHGRDKRRKISVALVAAVFVVAVSLGVIAFATRTAGQGTEQTNIALAWADLLENGEKAAPASDSWNWPDASNSRTDEELSFGFTDSVEFANFNESWIFSAALQTDDLEWDWDHGPSR